MANKPNRIVLDTNIFIYFLISNTFHQLDKRLKDHQIRLLFSEALFSEFLEVVKRPKFKKYFSQTDILNLIEEIHKYSEFIEVTAKVSVCRDEKDNFILALCQDGKADYLITGDEDLLILKKFKKTTIVKMSDYLRTS